MTICLRCTYVSGFASMHGSEPIVQMQAESTESRVGAESGIMMILQ